MKKKKDGRMGWDGGPWEDGANLFLLIERPREFCSPCISFLALSLFSRKACAPFALDVLAHSTQRCAEIVFVALNDHFELTDVARLLAEQAVFLAFWRVGRQLGAREKRLFEREDLRRLGLDLAACGEELLLELHVREFFWGEWGREEWLPTWYGVMSKSTLEGLAGRDSSPRFSSTVWLVRMRLVSCLMRALRSFIALLSSSCCTFPSTSIGPQDARRRSPRAQRDAGSSLEPLPPSPSLKDAS